MWRLKSCVNLLSYLVQLRWQWRIHSTFFPSVSQLASQCQSHHGSCLTIDIDQICPVCDLSPGSNVGPAVLGLPFPRKVETALFYHKPHLDLPGMRTGTQPVLRKEGLQHDAFLMWHVCVLERIYAYTIIAHTFYCLLCSQNGIGWTVQSKVMFAKIWEAKPGPILRHCCGGCGLQPGGSDSSLANRPWKLFQDATMPPKFVVVLEGFAPNQPGLRAHWGLALSRSVCAFLVNL